MPLKRSRGRIHRRRVRRVVEKGLCFAEEVAGTSARDLSDEEVVKVLTREAKKRREAAEAFVTLLLQSAASAEVPIYVVLTMRSDRLPCPAA